MTHRNEVIAVALVLEKKMLYAPSRVLRVVVFLNCPLQWHFFASIRQHDILQDTFVHFSINSAIDSVYWTNPIPGETPPHHDT